MASGKPICSNIIMGYCPITKFKLGHAKDFKNSIEYSDAILQIFLLPKEQYDAICLNSLNAAREFDYEHLTTEYINTCLNDL